MILWEMMLEVLIGVLVMEVDKVADEVTDMEVDKVTNMIAMMLEVVIGVLVMEVDKATNMIAKVPNEDFSDMP